MGYCKKLELLETFNNPIVPTDKKIKRDKSLVFTEKVHRGSRIK